MRLRTCLAVFLVHGVFGSDEVLERGKELVLEGKVSVSSDKEYSIEVSSSNPVRIHSEVKLPDKQHPVVFIIRTENAVKSWRIPSKSSGDSSEYASTLCRGSDDQGSN